LPFINIDRFVTHGFEVIVHGQLHAADRGKHADNAKYAKSDTQKGEEGAQLIRPEFLQRHFKTGPDDFQVSKHDSNVSNSAATYNSKFIKISKFC
jgi:hypothetical protein